MSFQKKCFFFFSWSFGAVSRSGFVFPFGFLLSTRTYKDKLAANSEVLKSEYRKRQTWCNKTFLECSALPKLFFFLKGFYLIILFFLNLFSWSPGFVKLNCATVSVTTFCLFEDFSFWLKNKQNALKKNFKKAFCIVMLNQPFVLIFTSHTKYSVIKFWHKNETLV